MAILSLCVSINQQGGGFLDFHHMVHAHMVHAHMVHAHMVHAHMVHAHTALCPHSL